MSGAFDAARALRAGLGDRRQAWEFIGRFTAEWTSPLASGDRFSEDVLWAAGQRLGVPLPAALGEACLLFGRRCDLTLAAKRGGVFLWLRGRCGLGGACRCCAPRVIHPDLLW